MEKLVYLVYERPSLDPAELRERFLDEVAPQLLALGPHALQMDLDDEHAQMQSMVPVPGDELPVRACVSLWIDIHDEHEPFEALLREVGTRFADYLDSESMYRDGGVNEHSEKRDCAEAQLRVELNAL